MDLRVTSHRSAWIRRPLRARADRVRRGARARPGWPVRDELKQLGGVVHGGVYGAIAEALAVRGTASGVAGQGKHAVSLATHTTSLHPIGGGAIHATALRRHRGRTTWVWEVEIADDDGPRVRGGAGDRRRAGSVGGRYRSRVRRSSTGSASSATGCAGPCCSSVLRCSAAGRSRRAPGGLAAAPRARRGRPAGRRPGAARAQRRSTCATSTSPAG